MRKLLLVLIFAALCLLAAPVYAQEATAEAEATAPVETTAPAETTAETPAEPGTPAEPAEPAEAAPTGLSTLILLIGLGAVAAVGLAVVARENFKARDGGDS